LTIANSIATAHTGGRYLSSSWSFTNFRELYQVAKINSLPGQILLAGNMAASGMLSTYETLPDVRLQIALSFSDK
jgi:hypothetical protein